MYFFRISFSPDSLNPFHFIPFHSVPFHSIPFHSIPFRSMRYIRLGRNPHTGDWRVKLFALRPCIMHWQKAVSRIFSDISLIIDFGAKLTMIIQFFILYLRNILTMYIISRIFILLDYPLSIIIPFFLFLKYSLQFIE